MCSIVFTTTATNRPEILRRTYASFSANLVGLNLKDIDLLINIDPLPNKININANVDVAKSFFKTVRVNTPDKPSFSTAINWLWSEAQSPYIFHLEDDWILLKPIKVKSLLKNMGNKLQIILRAYGYKYDKMVLSPSIIRHELYSRIGGRLDETINPEIQLRNPSIVGVKIDKSMLLDFPQNKIIVKDIGRKWMDQQDFKKPDKKFKFYRWIRK